MPAELHIDWSTKQTRGRFLVSLVERFKYSSYLEIGCRDNRTFDMVRCPTKVGVDPAKGGTVRLTSDEFFVTNTSTFDLIFIDGDHKCDQVYKDVVNSLKFLNEGGCIVMHDCIPLQEHHQYRQYKGGICNQDAWKACVCLRQRYDIDIAVGLFDCGVGVIRVRENSAPLELEFELTPDNMIDQLTWDFYVQNWQSMLNVLDHDQLQTWISSESVK